MPCTKQYGITVSEPSPPSPACAFLVGAVWVDNFPPVGDADGTGSENTFSVYATAPPSSPVEPEARIHTSFIATAADTVFTLALTTTRTAGAGWGVRIRKNGATIANFTEATSLSLLPFTFQLLASDAGATIDIQAEAFADDFNPSLTFATLDGVITCETGIRNTIQNAHVACGSECTGPGGDGTVTAGSVVRPTLAEANAVALAQAVALATADAALPENCCCLNWEFTSEDVPVGATASGDGNLLVATYAISTNAINQIVRFSGKVLVPACAIPPGTTNIIVQINFANCGTGSITYIWNYYDPSWLTGVPLASQAGATAIFSHSRLISGGAGVMFRVNLGDAAATFNGTGTVTISFS